MAMKQAAVLSALLLCACGSGGSSGSGGSDGNAGTCSTEARSTYPAGPYGVTTGATIADLTFVTASDGSTSLAALHADATVSLIYLATAAGWCVACIDEQQTLQSWHGTYAAHGLNIVVSVFEDSNYQPATAQYAAQWITQYSVDFTVVADPAFVLKDYYPNSDTTVTPLTLVIDACTMEIISSTVGVDTNAMHAVIEARL